MIFLSYFPSRLLMKELNILNVYQINILQHLLFMFKVKSSITPRVFNQVFSLIDHIKADYWVEWPIFKCFRVIFSLKKKTIQFPLSFNLYFQLKRAPKLSICHLPTKRSVWVFDVTNRTNGFSNFQSYYQVVMYLFNSLAKSCTLFWK